jgi:alpha-1,2-mannosyltransferase
VASALALALAVHFKSSPVVLALPFVLERRWRFSVAFPVWLAAVAGAIYAVHGPQPFLDFLRNARGVYAWSDLSFRENSIDSFLRSTAAELGGPLAVLEATPARTLLKSAILAFALAVAAAAAWRRPFAQGPAPGSLVLNTLPALSLLMLLASPLVWEHHPVFAALPFLVVTKRLRTPGEWALFTLAYGVVFLLPTFDFYPWSFGRLAGLLALLALLLRASRHGEDGELFRLALERFSRAATAQR